MNKFRKCLYCDNLVKVNKPHIARILCQECKDKKNIPIFKDIQGIENVNYVICKICGYKSTQLFWHIKKHHKLTGKQYRSLFPGEKLMISWNLGLTSETDIRVKKNAENSGKVRKGKKNQKSSETKKKKFKLGLLKIWNKGLTIEDQRVKNYTKNREKTIKEKFASGELVVWNKGQTKYSHPSIAKSIITRRETMAKI